MASAVGFDTSKEPTLHGFYGWTDTLAGVYYGPGSLATALPQLFEKIGVKKALVVTGKSLYTKTDVVAKVESVLKGMNAYGATFYEIGEHSPIAGIRRGMKAFQDSQCDVIVSVGGGSPVDASKAILYNIQQETGGETLRQIAIPTTLSAAEYSIGAGFTDESGQKVSVSSQKLAPSGVILDAELTLATPERLWLSTGIRALDHAVENLYRPLVSHPVKTLCYAALADLFKYLPASKADPANVAIRQKLQLASWMSLWPMKREKYSALGLSHALGHRLGATYGIPHGITSCLTLAPVVALQAEIQSPENKDALALAIYHLRRDSESTGSVEGDIRLLASLIRELVAELGLASNLRLAAYDVPEGDLAKIARTVTGSDEALQGKVTELLRGLM